MSCSSYAVTSALVVACPPRAYGKDGMLVSCGAQPGYGCIRTDGEPRALVHPARRRLADEQRTREVNPEVMKP